MDTTQNMTTWASWIAAPETSGFRVGSPDGRVCIAQLDTTEFVVLTPFHFDNPKLLQTLCTRLEKRGNSAQEARSMVDAARTLHATTTTDLASVPRFLAWFEAPYGPHTLAAMLHDQLIVDEVNGGGLKSDTLADSFFRDMMGAAGVPLFKRWLMWTAVAARTRFAAGGWRRISLIVWGLSAIVGIAFAGSALGHWLFEGPRLLDLSPLVLLGIAVTLPFLAGLLWGRQYGASVVAAAAGAWLIPAAVIVLFALVVYHLLEKIATRFT